MPDLETVDLEGVEIMAAGERVHGKGSPPEGDVYDTAALERLATDTNAVLEQVKPFVKLGHNSEQRLLKAEGFYDGDDQPQTGRLANLRVDGSKLKTDIKGVPRKLADLIAARAFPSRSTEILLHEREPGGEQREIVGRLAFLGAKPAAFKSLSDVAALYADQPADEEDIRVVEHRDRAYADLPDVIFAALSSALAGDAPDDSADTRRRMPDTDPMLRSFAEAAGLEGEASSDQILDAVRKLVSDKAAAETKATEAEAKAKEYGEAFAVIKADVEQGKAAHEELRVMKRDKLFAEAIDDKRLPPALEEKFKAQYDEGPDSAKVVTALIEALPPRDDLTRSFGRDPAKLEAEREAEKAYALFDEGDE